MNEMIKQTIQLGDNFSQFDGNRLQLVSLSHTLSDKSAQERQL